VREASYRRQRLYPPAFTGFYDRLGELVEPARLATWRRSSLRHHRARWRGGCIQQGQSFHAETRVAYHSMSLQCARRSKSCLPLPTLPGAGGSRQASVHSRGRGSLGARVVISHSSVSGKRIECFTFNAETADRTLANFQWHIHAGTNLRPDFDIAPVFGHISTKDRLAMLNDPAGKTLPGPRDDCPEALFGRQPIASFSNPGWLKASSSMVSLSGWYWRRVAWCHCNLSERIAMTFCRSPWVAVTGRWPGCWYKAFPTHSNGGGPLPRPAGARNIPVTLPRWCLLVLTGKRNT